MAAEPPRNRQEPEVRSGPAEMTPAARPVRKDVPAAIRNVSFKAAVRGYDRAEVDAYVKRVNRVIAELEVSSSPRAAVRHALDRVGEQVHGILERARDTADEVTATARQEADEITARAKAEASDLVVNASAEADASRSEAARVVADANAKADEIKARAKAEAEGIVAAAQSDAAAHLQRAEEDIDARRGEAQAQLREIQADIATVSEEHRGLLGDVRDLATRLEQLAVQAAAKAGSVEQQPMPTENDLTVPGQQPE